jgi:hypothetical protein
MHVLVLSGGLSAERDVSLRSGRRVAEALRTARTDWEVQENDVDAGLLDRLRAHRPDAIVPLLHGAAGEDGALRNVLESLRIPFVGSSAAASRLAFDKPIAKTLVEGCRHRHPAVCGDAADDVPRARSDSRARRRRRRARPSDRRQAHQGRVLARHLDRAPRCRPAGRPWSAPSPTPTSS